MVKHGEVIGNVWKSEAKLEKKTQQQQQNTWNEIGHKPFHFISFSFVKFNVDNCFFFFFLV